MRDGIDIVICLDDAGGAGQLGRCLFALAGQTLAAAGRERFDDGLALFVMLNRFSRAEIAETRAVVQPVRALAPDFLLTLHNWEYPEPFELRLPLLNWGLGLGGARYVMALEPGDMLYPGALTRLRARLRETRAAVAVGRLDVRPVLSWGDVVLPLPDAAGAGPEQAASFLIDRTRLPARELAFRAGAAQGEIAELIDRTGRIAGIGDDRAGPSLGIREAAAG